MVERYNFTRFFHWGPIIAIGIIKCITLTSLYMHSMWWPPRLSYGGMLNQSIFLLISTIATFNYAMATITGPGFLPYKWKPKDKKIETYLQYCTICEGYKAPRAHHCRKCDRCVMKMDHHCPWINTCVGWANHAYFTGFLAFSVLGSIHGAIILLFSFIRGIYYSWYLYYEPELATVHLTLFTLILCILSIGLAVGVVLAVGILLYFQLRAIVRNRTGIEEWIIEKAKYRRESTQEGGDDTIKEFRFPYDLGAARNIQEVLSLTCAPIGNGLTWNIIDDCDPYALTKEQIAQKADKRARTRTYMIKKKITGSWLPLWSQGIRVCLSPPCSDEPRIKLEPGDIVKVTRWKKHWLFGDKIINTNDYGNGSESKSKSINKDNLKIVHGKRHRGWFPRKCAVELVEPDSNEHQEHFSYKNKNL